METQDAWVNLRNGLKDATNAVDTLRLQTNKAFFIGLETQELLLDILMHIEAVYEQLGEVDLAWSTNYDAFELMPRFNGYEGEKVGLEYLLPHTKSVFEAFVKFIKNLHPAPINDVEEEYFKITPVIPLEQIKQLFHQADRLKEYPYFCLIPYLPARIHASQAQQIDRQTVFDFKDGNTWEPIVTKLAINMLRVYGPLQLQRMTLVVIPASTRRKTIIRYEQFCQMLSALTGIANGYSCIERIADQDCQKGQMNQSKIENLCYNQSMIKGRHLLLFDDVLTTGASFSQNAAELIRHNAKSITGLFLARTVSTKDL